MTDGPTESPPPMREPVASSGPFRFCGGLVGAGREAWEALRRDDQPGLVDRGKVNDGYLAGKLLERWLSRCAANRP